ncbi:MAG: FtsX-like permease family protein, partial [Vicinamibacterales bacterium]
VQMRLDLSGPKYSSAESRAALYRELDARLRSMPGIDATMASATPRGGAALRQLSIEGRPLLSPEERPVVSNLAIGLRYFEAIGTRPVRGRTFTEADDGSRPPVVVVNERFAATHFPNEDALGRRIRLEATPNASASEWLTIVGVAPNVRQRETEEAGFDPIVYVPYTANPLPFATILARSESSPAVVARRLREQIQALDADLAGFEVMTLDERLALAARDRRFFTSLFGIFAIIALALATVGLYAVTAYSVARRTREIGVRMALGAQARHVLWLVTRQASVQLGVGTIVGLAGGLGMGRLVQSLLVDTSGADPVTFAAVAASLFVLAVVAALIPARRAMRLDPVAALRSE